MKKLKIFVVFALVVLVILVFDLDYLFFDSIFGSKRPYIHGKITTYHEQMDMEVSFRNTYHIHEVNAKRIFYETDCSDGGTLEVNGSWEYSLENANQDWKFIGDSIYGKIDFWDNFHDCESLPVTYVELEILSKDSSEKNKLFVRVYQNKITRKYGD